MEEEEVVYLKIFDKEKGDVVFEGKVSTDVEPHELVQLGFFWERGLCGIYNKATNEKVMSFKGLQNNVELLAGSGGSKSFSGALYVGAEDKVLRKRNRVPSCDCVMMTIWYLSHEECEKAFKCHTLEVVEIIWSKLREIPHEIGGMKKLRKLTLYGLYELKSVPEDLLSLEELWIVCCGVENLPKRLKEAKMLKSITLTDLPNLQLNADYLDVFSRLKQLTIKRCSKVFTPSFAQLFWEMIKSSTDVRVLQLTWHEHNQAMVVSTLEENGSIVDGGWRSESYAHFFERNKENHERAIECVVHLLAIRRWRDALNGVPKEMVTMIAMMLWMMRCDVKAWTRRSME